MVHKVCRMQRNLIFVVDPKPTKNFIWDKHLSWWAYTNTVNKIYVANHFVISYSQILTEVQL